MTEEKKVMQQNCMNCEHRTTKDECAIKNCFAANFSAKGSKYTKGVAISYLEVNNCEYWKGDRDGK